MINYNNKMKEVLGTHLELMIKTEHSIVAHTLMKIEIKYTV